jgi:catechol 2,3-dioxygenase-like lactoylglutathione lyase family enzyme
MIKPRSVNHTAFRITDPEKTRKFYEGVLGLKVLTFRPNFPQGGFWFGAGENQIHVIQSKPGDVIREGEPDPVGPHIALEIEDFDEALRTLRENGVHVVLPEDAGIKVTAGRQMWVHDPDGNTIELRADK